MKLAKVILGIGAVLLASPFIALKVVDMQGAAEYQEELRLARKEGIPTSAAEIRAMIRPAAPEENAALFYKKLKSPWDDKTDLTKLTRDILFSPPADSEKATTEAKAYLAKHKSSLELVEAATAKPRCWFDRPWEDGAAVLFTEYAYMKWATKLLILRGTVACREGRVEDALADARRIPKMGEHIGEEPVLIGGLVRVALDRMGVTALGAWSLKTRNPAYAKEMEVALKAQGPIDLKAGNAMEMFNALTMAELSLTKEGREKIGLKEEDTHKLEGVMPYLMNRNRARAGIVRAHRKMWAAYELPRDQQQAKLEEANHEFYKAFLAFPTAAYIYEALSSGFQEGQVEMVKGVESKQLLMKGIQQALSRPTIPARLELKELKSPYDGKPVVVTFDGTRISAKMSGSENEDGNPDSISIPPNLKPEG